MRTDKRLFARLLLPSGILAGILLALGITAAYRVSSSQRETSKTLDQQLADFRALEELEITLREIRSQINIFLITGDPKWLEAVPPLAQEGESWLNELTATEQESEQHGKWDKVRRDYARFNREFARLRQKVPYAEQSRDFQQLVRQELVEKLVNPVHKKLDRIEEMVRLTSWQNRTTANKAAYALLFLGACGAFGGLIAGIGLTRAVSRKIIELSVPIHDAAGKLSEVVGPIPLSLSPGFTELKSLLPRLAAEVRQVVDRLHRSQAEVQRAEQLASLGQLAAGLAHELHNPLASIKILVQSAGAGEESPCLTGRDLEVLDEEITRLERTIKVFLDYARPPRPTKRILDLRRVLEQIAALTAGRAKQQGATIASRLPPSPVLVEADSDQLCQVFLNLLLNALDAVQQREPAHIEVCCCLDTKTETREALDGGGEVEFPWVTVAIADTGCGLPVQLGERIFEPFVSTRETGLGLGLFTCRRIVEGHGGIIRAANRREGGAVFEVRLPLALPPQDRLRTDARTPAEKIGTPGQS